MARVQEKISFVPPAITKIDDTGLTVLWLQDLALKIIYFGGYLNGYQMAERIALPFVGDCGPNPGKPEARKIC